jgi:hypothetical protein
MGLQIKDVTILSSALRTETTYSPDIEWLDAKAFIVLNVTAVTGTPGITPSLDVYDPTSGAWIAIWAGSARTPTTAVTYLFILTDTAFVPTGAGITESEQVYLGPRMRFVVTHADTDQCTYSVGMNRVNSTGVGI